jgi:hypothetical protein
MSGTDNEVIFSVEEAPEGGFVARALGHSIFTEADDLDALRDAVRDAVRCHFDDTDRPKVIRLHLVRRKSLRHEVAARSLRSRSRQGSGLPPRGCCVARC